MSLDVIDGCLRRCPMEHTVLVLDAAKSRNQPQAVDIDTSAEVQCLRRCLCHNGHIIS